MLKTTTWPLKYEHTRRNSLDICVLIWRDKSLKCTWAGLRKEHVGTQITKGILYFVSSVDRQALFGEVFRVWPHVMLRTKLKLIKRFIFYRCYKNLNVIINYSTGNLNSSDITIFINQTPVFKVTELTNYATNFWTYNLISLFEPLLCTCSVREMILLVI